MPTSMAWRPCGLSGEPLRAAARAYADRDLVADGSPRNNILIPAGYTYIGQLINHDLTPPSDVIRKTPGLNLDTIYGDGPTHAPRLYTRSPDGEPGEPGFYLAMGHGEDLREPDFVRDKHGRALIADWRNDSTVLLAQISLLFLRAHNRVLAGLAQDPRQPTHAEFGSAQQSLRWLYQYLIFHDYLARILGRAWVPQANAESSPGHLPDTFRLAAYRFGHAMVRDRYLLNAEIASVHGAIPIFSDLEPDLRGGRPLPAQHSLQWNWFFEFESSFLHFPQKSRKLHPRFVRALTRVPRADESLSVPFEDLMAGIDAELPRGSALAQEKGLPVVPAREPEQFDDHLFVYVLREADTRSGGYSLGPLGRQLIGPVFNDVLTHDADSYVRKNPDWHPSDDERLTALRPGGSAQWTFADLVHIAAMPETHEEIRSLTTP